MSLIERRRAYSGALNVSTPLRKQTEGEMQRSISFKCKSSTSSFLVLLMVVLTAVPAMFGQAYSGTVSGELTDATSAVVTGANVILTDQEKGFNFQTTSDSSGGYLFRSIPPGVYVVSVEAAGFAKTESAKFKVDVNENATANLTLRVAGATQTVEVGAQAQAIQTEDAGDRAGGQSQVHQ